MSISKIQHTLGCAAVSVLLTATLAGCGAAGTETSEAEVAAGELEEITELLNSDEGSCGMAAPDKTYSKLFPATPGFTAPATYAAGRNSCSLAYFVDVTNYRTGNTTQTNLIQWAGTTPTTQAACLNANLRVYVFEELANGTANYVGAKSVHGEWVQWFNEETGQMEGGTCFRPDIYVERKTTQGPLTFNLTTGKNYKFAISARDLGSNPVAMKPFTITNKTIAQID